MDQNNLVQMTNCAICPNMCRFDCPTTAALKRESASPSGKMRLGVMLEKGMLEPSAELFDHFYQCIGCKACDSWCPFEGLSVSELLNILRAQGAAQGLAPQPVYKIKEDLERWNTLFPQEEMLTLPVNDPGTPEVLFFAGCTYRAKRPQAVTAALNIIKSAGVKVSVIQDETCCGFPSGCLGLVQTSATVARKTVQSIMASGAKILVTSCPECYSAFSKRYPEIGINMGVEVLHFTQYAERLISEGKLSPGKLEGKLVYHDPCVLGRGVEIYDEPRNVLGKIDGLQVCESLYSRDKAHCCGAGQVYEWLQPEAAQEIAAGRAEELQNTEAEAVVTSCPFCEDLLGRAADMTVMDVAEVLWASINTQAGEDFALLKKAQAALKNDARLREQLITVKVDRAMITLKGKVDSWDLVVDAGHLAGALPGVYSVVNDLATPNEPGQVVHFPMANIEGLPFKEPSDVVIIGGGVVGCAIARELSRYDLKIVLLEKESDVSCGTSKANNGMIHPGIFVTPGTLKAHLNVKGNQMYDQAAAELDFPLKRCGLLGVVADEKEMFLLDLIKGVADQNGVPVDILRTREEVLNKEPNVVDNVVGGFFSPTAAMTSPYKVTVAYAENAVHNGVDLLLETTVTGIDTENGQVQQVITNKGVFPARYVINVAGLFADEVAEMAGPAEFTIHPRKGELLLFDKKYHDLFEPCMAEVTLKSDPHTKGGGIMMTIDGNVEFGPTAEEIWDKEDLSTSARGLETVLTRFDGIVKGLKHNSLIAYFAGLRAATYTEDFHIKPSRSVKGLINVAGIQSPGLASAPAIAEYVIDILRTEGLELTKRSDFDPIRRDIVHFKDLSKEARHAQVVQNKRYGKIVCRCEMVTEGEIAEAIHRPVPATTLDAVKRRTRAGMGRCQGGFCTPRVAHILAEELGIPTEEVTKDGTGSWLFMGRTKTGGI
ncbi:MAG: FAD-dependent oxidoreductase [Acidobacteriota bacterium]